MSTARTILAFAAAPAAASLTLGVMLMARAGGQAADLVAGALMYGLFSLVFTVPAVVVAGLPAFLLLKWVRRDQLAWLTVAGALVGLGAGLMLASGGTPDVHREPAWTLVLMAAAAGAAGGAVFALVRGRAASRGAPGAGEPLNP